VPSFNGRSHFFGIAARLMRQVLVDFASRGRQRDGRRKAPLEDAMAIAEAPPVALLDLNDALERLAAVNERQAKVIELRYFGGLSRGEVAEALDISLARVKRDIADAEAWLRAELTPHG
jgi:RNA polymerase sigma factor (TIGR02999 family)